MSNSLRRLSADDKSHHEKVAIILANLTVKSNFMGNPNTSMKNKPQAKYSVAMVMEKCHQS